VVKGLAAGDLASAPVEEKERRLLEFARRVTEAAHEITAADTQRLREIGWNDEQIAEAVYIAAAFAFFNRVADAFGLEPMGYLKLGQVTP
jgi:alkylhydroperoxidase family enzyme